MFRSGFVVRRRWFVGMTLLTVILALLVGGVLWGEVDVGDGQHRLRGRLNRYAEMVPAPLDLGAL